MNIRRYLGFAFAVFILAAGISGTIFLSLKPGLPFEYKDVDNKITSTGNYSSVIKTGDEIVRFNGIVVNETSSIEFYADMLSVGDNVILEVRSSGVLKNVTVALKKEYDGNRFIIISGLTGLAFWFLGLIVFIKKPGDRPAVILFVMLMLFSAAILTSPGKNDGNIVSYYSFIKVFHFFAYAGGISALLHFSFVFPKRLYGVKIFTVSVYTVFLLIAILINAAQINAMTYKDPDAVGMFHSSWTALLFALIAGTIWSTVNFFIAFFSRYAESDRRRVQWALWGMFAGVMPYVFLFAVPNLLGYPPPVSEEYPMAFLIIIPVSFVLGVSRYRLFDIEYIFSRSLVYFSVTLLVTSVFFAIVYVLNLLFSPVPGAAPELFAMISALFIALLFNPLRVRVQKIVDKYFYRIKFDFRNALRRFNDGLNECNTAEEVCELLLKEINGIIPCKKSAVILKKDSKVISLGNAASSEFTGASDITVTISPGNGKEESAGEIMLGEKLSGVRFLDTDFEIVKAFAAGAYAMINRIELRERIITAELEKKRLEELSEMKSGFVSSVSHELKTPLTSISMFAETLISGKEIDREKINDYAGIICGESDRLTRMINNILDFTKIERGIKQYYFENVCINPIVKYAVDSMEYQFRKNNIKVVTGICEERLFAYADRDAVAEALINLLSNAVKYSGENPEIEVRLFRSEDKIVISVKDNGRGIEDSEMGKIFDKFYRIKNEDEKHIGGAGIGLAIVRNIMEAHNGEARAESIPGRGSVFSLVFNVSENQT